MDNQHLSTAARLLRRRVPFAVATVVDVTGSSSAKPGAKALIDDTGAIIQGWVGGGCIARYVAQEAREAITARRPRLVAAEFDDDALGYGVPCGGVAHFFIEPILPPPGLIVVGSGETALAAAFLAKRLGFVVAAQAEAGERPAANTRGRIAPVRADYVVLTEPLDDPAALSGLLSRIRPAYVSLSAESAGNEARAHLECIWGSGPIRSGLPIVAVGAAEPALALLGEILALERRAPAQPMSRPAVRLPSPHASALDHAAPPPLWVVGSGKIVDEFRHLARLVRWPLVVTDSCPDAIQETLGLSMHGAPLYALVAAQHKDEHILVGRLLEQGIRYVALLASRKRAALTHDWLRVALSDPALLDRLFSPAGLDLGARTPAEIALSVLCEMLAVHRGVMTACASIVHADGSQSTATAPRSVSRLPSCS